MKQDISPRRPIEKEKEMEQIEKERYKTSDIYIASYLSALGIPFTYIKEGNKVVFYFKEKKRVEQLVLEYLNNSTSTLPIKKFVETLQSMKDLIFGHI